MMGSWFGNRTPPRFRLGWVDGDTAQWRVWLIVMGGVWRWGIHIHPTFRINGVLRTWGNVARVITLESHSGGLWD